MSADPWKFKYSKFSFFLNFISGQKFAILEEKMVISHVLRSYKLESIDRREDLTILGELVLRPKNGLKIKITPREVN